MSSAPSNYTGMGRGQQRPRPTNVREPHRSTTVAIHGRQAIAAVTREPVALQGPPPRPLPVDPAGGAVYLGDWVDMHTGQTLAHVHVFGRLPMHLYAGVREEARLVGRAVLTALGAEPPVLPHNPYQCKINLRMASGSFKDVGTLWMSLHKSTLDIEELTVHYSARPRHQCVTLHVFRCHLL